MRIKYRPISANSEGGDECPYLGRLSCYVEVYGCAPNTTMDNITLQISEVIKTWDTERMNQAKEALQFLKSLEEKETSARNSDSESSDMEVTVEETPRQSNRKKGKPRRRHPWNLHRARKTEKNFRTWNHTDGHVEQIRNHSESRRAEHLRIHRHRKTTRKNAHLHQLFSG
ncbi:hypothetical protein WA026_021195 [Henosepilachna vigintioctopunctata]|uniref:Uncharacterized protein n=1 Tax=Henosepilachna vigintioctopunctata TaxID=420089 RepID=A0AAW1U5D2_9CUCU